jgi:hypothetical protein
MESGIDAEMVELRSFALRRELGRTNQSAGHSPV